MSHLSESNIREAVTARRAVAAPPGLHDAEVIKLLSRHMEGEAQLLAEYAAVSGEYPNEFIRYIASMILDDERRHHKIIQGMINHLESGVDVDDGQHRIPFVTKVHDQRELKDRVRTLQRFERRDAFALWRLRRKLGKLGDSTLLGPLVDSLSQDTRKHRRLLRSIRKLAKS